MMQFERRYWLVASVGLLLAILAVTFDRLLLLFGAAGVGAWLLGRQYLFVQDLTRLRQNLFIEQKLGRQHAYTAESVPVTMTSRLRDETSLTVDIESRPPLTARGSTRDDRVASPGETLTHAIEFPIAGEYTFEDPLVTAATPDGLFTESFSASFGPSITVEPRAPRNVHVGHGGTRIAAAYGDHAAGRHGTGLNPAELREYQLGDAAHQIDWKATARLGEPFVREFEAQTDRKTVLLMDHRASTAIGHEGETKLAYLRQVALAFTNMARTATDPVALYGIGDEGVTAELHAGADADHYRTVRHRLHEFTPTTAPEQHQTTVARPADAHRAAERLRTDEDAFATTLRPFFERSDQYVHRVERDPLVQTIKTRLSRIRGNVWTVIFTDDTNRVELREAVKLARRGDEHVLVFLAPTVLFEHGGLADLDEAYERYLDFEQFRRELARIDRVSAYEVGPGDRLSAILTAQRRQTPTS